MSTWHVHGGLEVRFLGPRESIASKYVDSTGILAGLVVLILLHAHGIAVLAWCADGHQVAFGSHDTEQVARSRVGSLSIEERIDVTDARSLSDDGEIARDGSERDVQR